MSLSAQLRENLRQRAAIDPADTAALAASISEFDRLSRPLIWEPIGSPFANRAAAEAACESMTEDDRLERWVFQVFSNGSRWGVERAER